MSDPQALLCCERLRVEIGGLVVARELTLRMYPGQCWCLLGRNGAGKTTLLHTLAGLRPAKSGSIQLGDTALETLPRKQVAQRLGMLFQDQTDSFPASVREKVLQGRHPYLHAWQWETAADHELVSHLLHKLDLETLDRRNVQTLSGGERQRVAVATVLAQQCRLLLLDEPTNHLDLRHRFGLLSMLADDCREQRQALMMSLHDINLAARFCTHALLLMGNGEVLHGAVDDLLDSQVLESLYQHPLVEVETPSGRAWLPR
jgi:iron complex transport system ATP-binding protein